MKFYNIDVPETVATTSEQQPFSIAEAMAKSGTFTNEGYTTPQDVVVNTETKEAQPPAQEQQNVEPTTGTPQAEVVTPEVPQPPIETTPEATTQIETPTVEVKSWQEVLKQQQPNEVLKELGYDDRTVSLADELKSNPKMAAFFEHWKANGEVTSYLRELSTDYSKMSAEEVMRHQLRNDYPKATEKQLEILFNKNIIKAYNLDSDDEEQSEEGKLLLEAEADRHRDGLIAKQEQFLIPKPQEKPAVPEIENKEETARQQAKEAYQQEFDNSSFTKAIAAKKVLTLGEGDEAFNVPVDVNEVRDLLYTDKWAESISTVEKNPDGSIKSVKPNVERQLLIGAFAKDPYKFIKDIATHYKSLGGKATVDVIDNAKPPERATSAASEVVSTNPAALMAKQGVLR